MSEEIVPNTVEEIAEPEEIEASVKEITNKTPEPGAPEAEETPDGTPDEDLEARNAALAEELAKAQRALIKNKKETKEEAKAEPERKALDVDDYIDISTALADLDQEQQSFLAEQHTQTGKPLREIRESKEFQRWNTGYQAEQEAERALAPNSTQAAEDAPKSLAEALQNATLEEKEKLLTESGFYTSPRPKSDRVKIGTGR